MIAYGTRARAEATRRAIPLRFDGAEPSVFHKSEWMDAGQDPHLSPTIFLVEQPPNSVAPAHFHRQNQFQLFIEGDGSIGRHPLAPLTVHYAGAYTGYGPLVAGASGLKYFTIRPVYESGLIPISDRDKMVRGPKRHAQVGPIATASTDSLHRLSAPVFDDVLPVAEDGLGVVVAKLPPGAALVAQRPAHAGDPFLVVLAGSLRNGEQELGRWESAFATSDEALTDFTAGSEGAQVALLYTPQKASAYMPATADGGQC